MRRHPSRYTAGQLATEAAWDPDDEREIATNGEAIRRLRRCGLLRYRIGEKVVEATPAAIRAVALLTR